MSKKWTGDPGLQIRMAASFIILGILYSVFLGVLHYLGVNFFQLTIIASSIVLIQWYFSDKIVLWTSGAKIVSEQEYPRLHEIVAMLASNNNLPKPKVAIVNSQVPNAFATGKAYCVII